MKVLVTTDFFCEYELIETDTPELIPEYIKSIIKGEEAEIPGVLIGTHDDLWTLDETYKADKIFYISNYESEEE